MVQKRRDYAAAGRVMGYGAARIIFRHLLPNAITPSIVYWMTDMALAILLGSSLGYLGLGAQPPTAEWGVLIADGKNFMTTAWWMSIFPGIAIVLAGIGFSLLGDGLADLAAAGDDDARDAAARGARLRVSFALGGDVTAVRRRRLRRRRRRGAGPGRRIRLRQERDAARHPAPAAARRGQSSGTVALARAATARRMPERAARACAAARSPSMFQEPMTALNPVLTVGLQIDESLGEHTSACAAARRARAPSSCWTWSASPTAATGV